MSSFFLPDGTTLQLSSDIGDINHQGVASSNINGTEVQQTFPTTSTGTSTGNYNHLGIDGQNNNKWDFLNISGTLDGGYNFWHSSDAHAPLLITSIDDVGLTVDRSTSTSSLIDLPNITASGNNFAITATPINGAPWNINGYGNPVQVLHNTAHLTTGITYFAAGLSPQTVQIALNADGSGVIDTSDLASQQQPILASVGGSSVITTKTSILTGEGLYIKTDPYFAPAVLSANGLSISDSIGNNSTANSSSITVMDSSSLNTQLSPYALNINGNAETSVLDSQKISFTDANANNSTLNPTSIVINSNYNAGSPLNIVNIQNYYMEILDNDQQLSGNYSASQSQFIDGNKTGTIGASFTQHVNSATNTTSLLTSSDLTFNSVSLPSAVATNTTNIATNTTNIATNTSTIATLQIKQTITTNQYISAVITADARPPIAPTTTIAQQYAFTPSWFFKNSFASNNKINWYVGGDLGMVVADVLGLYMNVFNPSMTSNDLFPFITIYTTNDTPNPPNFYKSKRTYLFNQSITPVVNTRYLMFENVSGTCPTPFHYGSVLNNMQLSTVAGSNVGAFAPTESILAFAIGTNSASAINTVEFAINKFGVMTANGTQEIAFIPN